ncbi:heterokaryon incompatibility protein-domain-containing protein [Echria macrotheca]|uniref:Heterokaryon incompatibility protein-domain-containing protein n=1 Tax=Echria macrotheca TaxID=438768 RepID=A0AAJ0BIN9_9PEZI|nr:heterokaryon incompatibility protein-domain-containing protein [Echria macrotheca]
MANASTPTQASPYVGQVLAPSRQQIRLVQLLPGTHDAPIVCSSCIVSLSETPPRYTALSYVWGDGSDRQTITFNDDPGFLITRNLHTALGYLRHEETTTVLWVDAICINQADEGEKNHQVPLMGFIYRNAAETCIWLGKESADSDLAMHLISQLDGDDLHSTNNSLDTSGLQAILALQKRSWWSRVWVIQEALLSPNPTVRCGLATLPMEAFMVLDDIRRSYHRRSREYVRNGLLSNLITQFSRSLRNPFASVITDWPDLRRELLARPLNGDYDQNHASRLSYWTQSLEEFGATDPRDKIYGLLGLATDADREYMRVALERRMTVSRVYTHATRLFISSTRDLLFLSFDVENRAPCPRGEDEKTGKLPSWVMDYSHRPLREDGSWFRPDYIPLCPYYNAIGNGSVLGAHIRTEPFPFDDEALAGLLFLRGLVVDTVVFASPCPHIRPHHGLDGEQRTRYSIERLQATAEHVLDWEQKAMAPGWADPYDYNTGGSLGKTRLEAFRRTMLGNRTGARLQLDYHESEADWDTWFDVLLGRTEMPSHDGSAPLRSEEEALLQYLLPLRLALIPKTAGKSFFITSRGYFGLGPLTSKPGDAVCVVEGAAVPFVLRAVDDAELVAFAKTGRNNEKHRHFKLVGESYVHGVSDGEWIAGQSETQVVDLVLV